MATKENVEVERFINENKEWLDEVWVTDMDGNTSRHIFNACRDRYYWHVRIIYLNGANIDKNVFKFISRRKYDIDELYRAFEESFMRM